MSQGDNDNEAVVNERYRREIQRLETLIERGEELSDDRKLESHRQIGHSYRSDEDKEAYAQWKVNSKSILRTIFGEDSTHLESFTAYSRGGSFKPATVQRKTGVLRAALEDVQGGYLLEQETLVAGEVFDSVLERASTLCDHGFEDSAAVLGRTVLEDGLRRLAEYTTLIRAER